MRIIRLINTVRYLKLVQIASRVWRKLPARRVSESRLEARHGQVTTPFPSYCEVWDGKATFRFLNEAHRLGAREDWNNPSWKKLWLYNLHYFDCLRNDLSADGKIRLMLRWIRENPVGAGNGWEPYPISLRVVNWIKFLCDNVGTADERREIEASLCIQVRHLLSQLEYHLLANHLLANAKALVFAGWYFSGEEADRWLRKGMAIYRDELPEQVLADGVHFERSAMYHSIMYEDVLDCLNVTGDALFAEYASRMAGGLDLLTGPDGRIALFNDAAHGIALPPSALRGYASRLPLAEGVADSGEQSGFVRLERGDWTLIVKCGTIGPRYQPGHAHADSLTFELWYRSDKVITDTGTDRYVVDDERKRQRGTPAHNTLDVEGRNSSEVWAGHRVAMMARTRILRRDDVAVEAECIHPSGVVHRRELRLSAEGLTGRDVVENLKGADKVSVRFHFAPNAESIARLASDEEIIWDECDIAEEFGKMVRSRCASIARTGNGQIEWSIR